ncbi:MAG: hypothetical protein HQM16_19485 [Deltaproteobacteria bacterium]|nr:hypothetical protein [Deltaproteobacteria bacterium]
MKKPLFFIFVLGVFISAALEVNAMSGALPDPEVVFYDLFWLVALFFFWPLGVISVTVVSSTKGLTQSARVCGALVGGVFNALGIISVLVMNDYNGETAHESLFFKISHALLVLNVIYYMVLMQKNKIKALWRRLTSLSD